MEDETVTKLVDLVTKAIGVFGTLSEFEPDEQATVKVIARRTAKELDEELNKILNGTLKA